MNIEIMELTKDGSIQVHTPEFYYRMVMHEPLSKHPIKAHQLRRLQKVMHKLYSCIRAAETPSQFYHLVPLLVHVAKLAKRINATLWKCDMDYITICVN